MASEKNRASVRPVVVVVVVSQKENLLAKTNDKQQKQLVINSVFQFLWQKPIQTRTNGRRITQSSLMSTVIDVHARWCTRHGGGGTARGPAPSSPPPAPGVVADFEVRLGRRHGTRPSSAASAPPPPPASSLTLRSASASRWPWRGRYLNVSTRARGGARVFECSRW